jgi:hypothetical protein
MNVVHSIERGLLQNRWQQPELYPFMVHPANVAFVRTEVNRSIADLQLYVGDADFVEISIEVLNKWLTMPHNDGLTLEQTLSHVNTAWVREFERRVRANAGLVANYQKLAVQQHLVPDTSALPRVEFARKPRKELELHP